MEQGDEAQVYLTMETVQKKAKKTTSVAYPVSVMECVVQQL